MERIDPINACPQCGESVDVTAVGEGGEDEKVWMRQRCDRCGCVYEMVYAYAGTEVVEEGDGAGRSA